MARESDLQKLRYLASMAKRLGADEARIVKARDIVVDKRVRLKCAVPICADYGRHLLCPPNIMSVDEFSDILRLYRWAIIVQIETDVDSSDKSPRPLSRGISRKLELSTGSARWERKLHKLVNQLEALAFKNGYYLAAGFIGGNCCLCRECVGSDHGQLCRQPFNARPSMQAMGIDVVRTCKNAGLPIRLSSEAKVRWTGMVLVE